MGVMPYPLLRVRKLKGCRTVALHDCMRDPCPSPISAHAADIPPVPHARHATGAQHRCRHGTGLGGEGVGTIAQGMIGCPW